MDLRKGLIALVTICTVLPVVSHAEFMCKRSVHGETLFSWRRDPELFIFARGNDLPTSRGREVHGLRQKALRRVLSHGNTLRFSWEALSASSRSHETSDTLLVSLLGNGGPFDLPTELRIGEKALATPESAQRLAHFLCAVLAQTNKPLLTIDEDVSATVALTFRQMLREQGVAVPVGKVGTLPADAELLRCFDYAVVNPNLFPRVWRDQAAVSYARSLLDDLPIIFSVSEARFLPELFWVSTGVAGIRYEIEPENGEQRFLEDIRWRRALCSVLSLSGFAPPILDRATGPMPPLAVLSVGRLFWLAIPPTGGKFVWEFSPGPKPVNAYTFWFDANNDVYVIRPPYTECRHLLKFDEKTPRSDRIYIFGTAVVPSSDDRQTTIGPILPLEGEIPEPD